MKTYRLFFVSVYRFIWNTFLYDISSILLIIIFKLLTPVGHDVFTLQLYTTRQNIRRIICIFYK